MGGEMPPMVRFMSAAWDCAWRGKIALLEGDLSTFGGLMNRNHHVVDEMMRYCGFTDGAGWANNLFIEKAISNNALGAKLTGAGSGGSIFALVRPGDEDKLVELWQKTAADNGLINAEVIKLVIANDGLRIEKQSVNKIN
jgi:mevalonate kinase